MKDFNVLSYVGRSLWAITEDKWAEMVPALIRHAKGTKLTETELLAFMGGRDDNEPPKSSKRGTVAIVPVRGVIAHRMDALSMSSGGASCERIDAMIDQVAKDDAIAEIAYDFDTPGGTVTGLKETSARMFALRGIKKQTAFIKGQCCSAGIWLASQCDEIIATESSEVGSIGVFAAHKDLSEALAKEGIKIRMFKSEKLKAEGNPFEPLTDEAAERIQARVDASGLDFRKDVGRGRGLTAAQVREQYGAGITFTAKDAKAVGLIDRIGSLEDYLAKPAGRSRSGARAEGEAIELLAGIPGHSHTLDEAGNLTCGCSWPADKTALAASAQLRDRIERF